jgi:hypothetical protein
MHHETDTYFAAYLLATRGELVALNVASDGRASFVIDISPADVSDLRRRWVTGSGMVQAFHYAAVLKRLLDDIKEARRA